MSTLSDAAAALDTTLGTLETEIQTLLTAAIAERKLLGTGYTQTANHFSVTKAGREAERATSHVQRAVSTAVQRALSNSQGITPGRAAVDLSVIYPA